MKFLRLPKRAPGPKTGSAYKHFGVLRLLAMIHVGIFAIGFVVVVYFLYQSIYTTLDQVDALLLLQPNTPIEVIDFQRLDSVRDAWDTKHALDTTESVRDPFVAGETTATTSTIDSRPIDNSDPTTVSSSLPTDNSSR